MTFLCLAFVLLFGVCSSINFSFPTTHHILLLQKQTRANSQINEQALDYYVTFAGNDSFNHSQIMLNFTVLQEQDDSLIHIKTLSAFCKVIAARGISTIISLDESSHPNLMDIYASYVGIPLIKIFHSDQPHLIRQEWNTVLFIHPNPLEWFNIIYELLEKYQRDRVVVISQEDNQHNVRMASRLMTILRNGSYIDVAISFPISIDKTSHLRAINIILSLRVTAVVLLLEEDLALTFLEEAQLHGFMSLRCVWIVGYPFNTDFKSMRFPLMGKIIGIRLTQRQSGSSSHPKKADYLKDSVDIIRRTLQYIGINGAMVPMPPTNCVSLTRRSSGELLYKTMKSVEIDGKTGRIEFDKNGFRTNVTYEVYYLSPDGSKSGVQTVVIAQYQNGLLRILRNGWPPKTSEDTVPSKFSKGRSVRIVAMDQDPYVVVNKIYRTKNKSNESCALGVHCLGRNGEHSCCSGYCIDLLKLLMKDVGFSPEVHLVKDGKYGALNRTTGQWSGLIGELVRGDADMALADLTINKQRSTVVDFTHPFIDAGMGVLIKVYRRGINNWTGFMDPFSVTLWVAVIITINFVLLWFWWLERFSPYGRRERDKQYGFNLVDAIWYTWSLVFQTFDVGTRPKSFASRILALSFAFSMLIIITSYTANLAAFLVVEEEILPLSKDGIRDPKLQNPPSGFKIATIQDSSFERFFQATDDPVMHRIWQHMKHNSIINFSEAITQMDSGELQIFVGDEPTFQTFAAKHHDCSFKVVGKTFFQSGFGMALSKHSSLTAKISDALIHYEEYDTTKTLRHRWFVGKCSMENEEGAIFARLSLQDLGGLFLAICFAVAISVIFFVIENYTGLFRTSSKYMFRR